MDPISADPPDLSNAYAAALVRRANDQQKVDGANAVRLVEAARPDPRASSALPPDATISLRV